jgi:transketolase
MMPVGTGLSLGLKARKGPDALVICHCGDAGWISGQALNGLNAASLFHAPIVFVMHRNGIQLSGTTAQIMDKDPRPVIESLGIEVLEIASLHDRAALFAAYHDAMERSRAGRPSLIYPVGYASTAERPVTVRTFGDMYGIEEATDHFAAKHGVSLETPIWIPGSLMSFRDAHAMLECVFYVNRLRGGEGHHDGGMKGRDAESVLSNPMLRITVEEQRTLEALEGEAPRIVVTKARPAKGTPNLALTADEARSIELPGIEKWVTARLGSEAAYLAIARKYPERCFFVSCDLNPSTRLGKASAVVPGGHHFEMSIQEQAAALLTDGLGFMADEPQLNVFATFTAFIEGIAREGFEFWRYQRNLNGVNDGLNVVMHLSHVGACTGRDHFSGWSLDWVNLALGYLPYLRRFYAPADARAAFLAVKDAAAEFGGHIVAIPRDNLPVLSKQGTSDPLWNADEPWTPVTLSRQRPGARAAILALGAPSFVAVDASDRAAHEGVPADVYIVNGFPVPESFLDEVSRRYHRVLTIEDGLIGTPESGRRGFAAFVSSHLRGRDVELRHFGIVDPQVAPSEYYLQVWEHFGMTQEALTSYLLQRRA